jgi:methylation protein EvaC
MFKEFLDLGRHPIANAFLQKEDFDNEFLFDLKVCWDDDSKLVSIKNFVEPERIFNEDYPYNTSNSFPMIKHFFDTAENASSKS